MSKKMLPDNKTLIDLYVNDKKNLAEICEIYGLSKNSRSNLSRTLRNLGIEIRQNKGTNHHNWKGGKIIKGDGYYGIWCPSHKRADKQGYVYEHTLVIEKNMGILPNKNEVIHHIDTNKLNNDIENLIICNNKEHTMIHRSIELLVEPLLERKIIFFDKDEKKYKLF